MIYEYRPLGTFTRIHGHANGFGKRHEAEVDENVQMLYLLQTHDYRTYIAPVTKPIKNETSHIN
jgi:hypothetical protein